LLAKTGGSWPKCAAGRRVTDEPPLDRSNKATVETRRSLARIRELAQVIEALDRVATEDTCEVALVELRILVDQAHQMIIDHMAEASIDVGAEDREDEHARLLAAAPCGGRS
jgi:hypothetical protein